MSRPTSYTNLPTTATDATPDGSGGYVPGTGTQLTAALLVNNPNAAINALEQTDLGLSTDGPTVNKVYGRLANLEQRGLKVGATLASASTLTLPAATVCAVTGTTSPVTAITVDSGVQRWVLLRFTSAVTISNGTIDCGGADVAVPAGGVVLAVSDGTQWHVLAASGWSWQRGGQDAGADAILGDTAGHAWSLRQNAAKRIDFTTAGSAVVTAGSGGVASSQAGTGPRWTQSQTSAELQNDGATRPYMRVVDADDLVAFRARANAPSTTNLPSNGMAFYLDEATNTLKVSVKYAGGTVKTGSIALS